jgi:hypothetical protein
VQRLTQFAAKDLRTDRGEVIESFVESHGRVALHCKAAMSSPRCDVPKKAMAWHDEGRGRVATPPLGQRTCVRQFSLPDQYR